MSSKLNQTSTPLAGDATYDGSWEFHRGWEAVSCLVNTDQSGTVTYNFSGDAGTTTHHSQSYAVTADVTFHKMVSSKAHWFKVSYTNGATLQTSFSLLTQYHRENTEIEIDGSDSLAVSAVSLPLPSGASTSANQTTGNASMSSIDGKITACNTGAVVVASGTIDLGATDNAVLDSIQTNTSDCAVNTNAIGVDTTSIDGKITACNTGAVVVASGTIDLGATDNAVLDSIALNTTGLNGCVSGSELQCDVVSSALPTGASTSANQTTANASLSSIDGKITACNTGAVVVASGTIDLGAVDNAVLDSIATNTTGLNGCVAGSELQCDVVSSALPAGASTSANQTTGNASLSSMDGKLPASVGQKAKAASFPVTLASDEDALTFANDTTQQGSAFNLMNAVSVTGSSAGTDSTAVDVTNFNSASVLVSGSDTAAFNAYDIFVSPNSGTNYYYYGSMSTSALNSGGGTMASRFASKKVELNGMTHLKITAYDTETVSATVIGTK